MAEFGASFIPNMVVARCRDGQWGELSLKPTEAMPMHPAAHVLHYGSECFEGLKAYRSPNGGAHLFRPDRHVARMRASAEHLLLPSPPTTMLEESLRVMVREAGDAIPDYPGSLYLRPCLLGLDPNIGSAGKPSQGAIYFVLASPVGDYFAGGVRPLRLLIDDENMRATPGFGQVKTGGNYAAALRHIQRARRNHNADQVLFCPGGDVQETGAANFLLIRGNELITKRLDGTILPGITRDSLLQLARDAGLTVTERDFTVDELLEAAPHGEAALSGTAAVLTPVGTLIHGSQEITVGDGNSGPWMTRLREALGSIQSGHGADPHGWRVSV